MTRSPTIKAETFHVDELVGRALQGRIRVPRFQRGLRWRATDVQRLFDSINRGFPIGTLLMWRKPSDTATISFGPVEVSVSATDDSWWVVDGQQRLTSLVAALRHPDPFDPDDPFVVYFDMAPEEGKPEFFRPHRLRKRTPLCVPLARCFDAADFQSWLFDFVQETGKRELIETASGVATRIRNYRVPVYVVETEDAEIAREIFLRTNRAGRRMEAHEVFAALAPADTSPDIRPVAIANRLSDSFGPVEPNVVTKAAKALVSDNVTSTAASPNVPNHDTWMSNTERALDRALRFIVECGVPHTRLLPAGPTPIISLARFFHKHRNPRSRNKRLLRRWLWRGFFSDGLGSDAKTLRRAVVAVTTDEDTSVQALLQQVPKSAGFDLKSDFDARDGQSRLAILVMAEQKPRCFSEDDNDTLISDDDDYSPDIFAWLRDHGAAAFSTLPGLRNCPESRFLTPGATPARMRDWLLRWCALDLQHPALASHLVPPSAARALLAGDLDRFLTERRRALLKSSRRMFNALAEPNHSDRPALSTLDTSK